MTRKKRKLSRKTVKAANKEFWAKHPEMNYRLIKPQEKELAKEWREIYDRLEETEKKNDGSVEVKKVVLSCANKSKPKKDEKKPEEKEKCKYTIIKITKSKRKYDLLIDPNSKTPCVTTLQVIAGEEDKKELITVVTEGKIGPCSKYGHENKLYYTPHKPKSNTDDKLEFEVLAPTIPALLDTGMEFYPKVPNFEFIWPQFVTPNSYSLTATSCGASTKAFIDVYPDIKTTASAECNFEKQWPSKPSKKEEPKKFEYSLKGECDGRTVFKIESGKESKDAKWPSVQTLGYLFKKLAEDSAGLLARLKKACSFWSIKIGFKISLTASVGWEEIEGSPDCGFMHNIEAGGELSFEGKIDFVKMAARSNPVLSAILWVLEEFNLEELKLELVLGGAASITAKLKKDAGTEEVTDELEPVGKTFIKLELTRSSHRNFIVIQAGGGFKTGGIAKWKFNKELSSIEVTENGLMLNFMVSFEGLMVYFQYFANIGLSKNFKDFLPEWIGISAGETKYGNDKAIEEVEDLEKSDIKHHYILDPNPTWHLFKRKIFGKEKDQTQYDDSEIEDDIWEEDKYSASDESVSGSSWSGGGGRSGGGGSSSSW